MLKKLKNKKGFTLIEIIVVIVILAVLMAVAVPSVLGYINEGNNAKYETIARSVLINAQTEYAKEVTDGGYNETTLETKVGAKNYGDGVTVKVTGVTLTNGSTNSDKAEDQDIASVKADITPSGSDKKEVTISANKKVTIA